MKFSQFKYTVVENECGINIDVIRVGAAETSFKVKVLVEHVTSSSSSIAHGKTILLHKYSLFCF